MFVKCSDCSLLKLLVNNITVVELIIDDIDSSNDCAASVDGDANVDNVVRDSDTS